MKKTNTIFLLALTVIFLGSCTVERRLHNKGFHVQWSKKYKADKTKESKTQELAVNEFEEDAKVEETLELKPISAKSLAIDEKEAAVDVEMSMDAPVFESELEDESMTNELSTVSNSVQSNVAPTQVEKNVNHSQKQVQKKQKKSAAGSSGKSQMIALLLVIFFGIIGVHRFYLGYTGVGVLMVLTLGLFGILTLIDLIRIAVGNLGPKNGEYGERLEDL